MGIRNSENLVKSEFTTDERGNPTGGVSRLDAPGDPFKPPGDLSPFKPPQSPAMLIFWQEGMIGPEGQNGAFVEDVLEAARQRLQWFNSNPKFRCRENSLAITKIEEALQWLDWRTRQRQIQGVENTYESHS